MKQLLTLNVNGETHVVYTSIHKTLLEVLREDLLLTGVKHGCELGECGACTVLIDGEPVLSCLTLPIETQGSEILTVEGLSATLRGAPLWGKAGLAERGAPHPLQTAFAELGAAQCGYCTPGLLVTAKALLDHNPQPTRDEIRAALAGNICRCTGYVKIWEAVELAAERMRSKG